VGETNVKAFGKATSLDYERMFQQHSKERGKGDRKAVRFKQNFVGGKGVEGS